MFVEFKDVSFKYYGSDEYVLNQLSFAIEKGSMLAILGHNGSGKSTIAKLMMGLLEVTSGDIYIEGEKLTENNEKEVWYRNRRKGENKEYQLV